MSASQTLEAFAEGALAIEDELREELLALDALNQLQKRAIIALLRGEKAIVSTSGLDLIDAPEKIEFYLDEDGVADIRPV